MFFSSLFLVLTSIENIQDNVKELFENEKGIENVGRFLKLIENVRKAFLQIINSLIFLLLK